MTITESDLAAIEARARAATGGEWAADEFGNVESSTGYRVVDGMETLDPENCYTEDAANGQFIAHCGGDNGDVLRLVAEVRRLRAEVGAKSPPRDRLTGLRILPKGNGLFPNDDKYEVIGYEVRGKDCFGTERTAAVFRNEDDAAAFITRHLAELEGRG
jgi:hypothetical protein